MLRLSLRSTQLVGRGNAVLLAQDLDKPAVCPQFPTPDYDDARPPVQTEHQLQQAVKLIQSLCRGVLFPVRQWSEPRCLSLVRQYGRTP
jgi:hypothetical protein